MIARATGLLFFAVAAFAQPPAPAANAAVSGVVRDSVTGEPLANYNVSTDIGVTWVGNAVFQSRNMREVKSVTDESGRYQLSGLPPGTYRISASNSESPGLSGLERRITVGGRDIDHVDFRVLVAGSISGRVVDENKEPVPNIDVALVVREYFHGVLGYFIKQSARTDDHGQYKLRRVEPRKPVYVMAQRREIRLPDRSEVPLDPRLRRRAIIPTFYPNSPDKEGAAAIVIRPRENREGVDIELKKSPSYCVEGTASGPNGPGRMTVQLTPVQPSTGRSNSGGVFGPIPAAQTGPDGKFRICDLYKGEFRLAIDPQDSRAGGPRALETIAISDRDLKNVEVMSRPLAIEGEVAFDGPAPEGGTPPHANISLQPLLRQANGPGKRVDVPSTFTLEDLVPAEYGLQIFPFTAKALYVKEATFGGRDVLYGPLNPGTAAPGSGLRIVIGQDGATFTASVSDKDGNPLAQAKVIVMPANVASDAMLQAAISEGETDQQGQFISSTLAPGKYLIGATFDEVDPSPESIARLWRARDRFTEIELAPKVAATVSLRPVSLE